MPPSERRGVVVLCGSGRHLLEALARFGPPQVADPVVVDETTTLTDLDYERIRRRLVGEPPGPPVADGPRPDFRRGLRRPWWRR
jgi:hypothetical protein